MVEVIKAIVAYKGISREEFEGLRAKKLEERGGFRNKTLLVEVQRHHTK